MATVTQRKRDSHRKQQLPVWQPHQWISPRLREVAYDQIGEASQQKLAQAVVFWLMRQQV